MPVEITIPRLGWNMDEGTFAGWLKPDGAAVRPGDALFTLEGEKGSEDIECLDAGTLRIAPDGPKTGDRVAVGLRIGYILRTGEEAPALPSASSLPGDRGSFPPPLGGRVGV